MTNEMSFAHELCENSLSWWRSVKTRRSASSSECRNECTRHDHVRQAHSGKQHLAESADVNHAAIVINPLKCLQRSAAISKLAQVVVFDYPRARLCRVFDQLC